MKKLFLTLMLLLATISTADAEVYRQGIVSVIYERNGAYPLDSSDRNQNSVPDSIEDIATQINAARELFHDVCGFPDPLKSDRYKNTTAIEIDIDLKSNMENHNGLAYSGKRKSKIDPNKTVLHIRIASTVDAHKNATPAHEYFHLIQYGATYFRNKWYLEGMARWSQDSVNAIKKYPTVKNMSRTLTDKVSVAEILNAKYSTARLLWYPLALDCKDKVKIPSRLMSKYKYVDGAAVFEDDVIYGANVMKAVLNKMQSKEAQAAVSFGGLKQWRKDGVRSEKNNDIILDCVRAVYSERRS